MKNQKIPFSMVFVLSTTLKHMKKCVDISIGKTVNRVSEFEGDATKSREIIGTLSELHSLNRMIEDFQNKIKTLKD